MLKIRNQAEAARAYARQAKNNELEVYAAEIKLRAEYRAGQLLKQNGHHRRAGNTKDTLSRGDGRSLRETPTLAELEVTNKQSSR